MIRINHNVADTNTFSKTVSTDQKSSKKAISAFWQGKIAASRWLKSELDCWAHIKILLIWLNSSWLLMFYGFEAL